MQHIQDIMPDLCQLLTQINKYIYTVYLFKCHHTYMGMTIYLYMNTRSHGWNPYLNNAPSTVCPYTICYLYNRATMASRNAEYILI